MNLRVMIGLLGVGLGLGLVSMVATTGCTNTFACTYGCSNPTTPTSAPTQFSVEVNTAASQLGAEEDCEGQNAGKCPSGQTFTSCKCSLSSKLKLPDGTPLW